MGCVTPRYLSRVASLSVIPFDLMERGTLGHKYFKLKPTNLPLPSTSRCELKNLCKLLALNPALMVVWGFFFFKHLIPLVTLFGGDL